MDFWGTIKEEILPRWSANPPFLVKYPSLLEKLARPWLRHAAWRRESRWKWSTLRWARWRRLRETTWLVGGFIVRGPREIEDEMRFDEETWMKD
eukprot:747217-Hanusia_phi.AAC.2